ncbi:MAG: hypothetical protein ACM3WS_07630 [Bacillota bacterium]
MTPVQQQADLNHMTQVYAAVQNGRPDLASQLLRDRATALMNSGDTEKAQAAKTMADWVEQHPDSFKTASGIMLASVLGPDKFASAFQTISEEPGKTREANAKADTAEADATLKNLGIIGQTLGAMDGKDVQPDQVATAFKSLAARGVIKKDELPDYLASIPKDTRQLQDFIGTFKMAGMSPKEQMTYTTPTADAKLSSDTQIKTTAMNNATQLKVQDRIDARQEAKGDAEPTLDQDTLTTMAQQYLAGDKSVMQNLGRGAQGSANIVALRKAITQEAKAQGLTGPQIAAKMAEFAGTMAGQRTAGTRIANVEMAASEAESLIPLAREASAAVARSGLLPFGKAQIMFNNQTNDPALRQFAAANNSLINVYARAISPSGVPTVADKEHAREMLSTAMDHKSYLAVLDQMQREISAARTAPQAVRKSFSAGVSGDGGHTPAAPALPAGWTVKVH